MSITLEHLLFFYGQFKFFSLHIVFLFCFFTHGKPKFMVTIKFTLNNQTLKFNTLEFERNHNYSGI